MLYATNIFPGDGTTRQFELTFVGGYLDRDHVIAYYEDNLSKVQTPIDIGTVTWLGPYTVQLPPGAAASPGTNVVFARQTPREPLVGFQGSSRITEANLDLAHRQGLFVAVESLDSSNQLKDGIRGVQEMADEALLSAAAAEASASSAAGAAGIAAGQASQAMSSATAAQVQANAASGFAADALLHRNAAAASVSNPDKIMACRFEYVNSSQCRLAGFGGNTVVIGGVARALPAGGATLALNAGWALDTIQYVYAYWTGTAVAIYASTVVPQMNTTYGYQTQNADPNTTLVGAFVRRAAGFVDYLTDRNVVSLYNQPARVFSASLGSALNVANGGTTTVLSATLVVLGGSVDFNGGGQVSCTGYARTLPRINGFTVNGAATMQGNASVALGYIVARNCSIVGVGVIIPSVALVAISAAAMAVGGDEAGWHLMGVHHP